MSTSESDGYQSADEVLLDYDEFGDSLCKGKAKCHPSGRLNIGPRSEPHGKRVTIKNTASTSRVSDVEDSVTLGSKSSVEITHGMNQEEPRLPSVVSPVPEKENPNADDGNFCDDNNLEGWDVEEDINFDPPENDLGTLSNPESEEDSKNVWSVASWNRWDMSSLLSTATESVTSLTTHVSSGISSVLETGLGVPQPEELAKSLTTNVSEKNGGSESEKTEPSESIEDSPAFGLGNIFGGVGQLGNKMLSEGLNTLETLGKKTMEVLQEGDPGLKKKRALLFNNEKTELSQILQEAKEAAEISEKEEQIEPELISDEPNFDKKFDDFNGLMHLQALEMISKQCSLKVQTKLVNCTHGELMDMQQTMSDVQELFSSYHAEEEKEGMNTIKFLEKIEHCISELTVNVSAVNITEMNKALDQQLEEIKKQTEGRDLKKLYQEAVISIANFTALAMEVYHRIAEQMLVKPHHDTAAESDNLTELTKACCERLTGIADSYNTIIFDASTDSDCRVVTDIFVEAANGTSYILNAYEMFIPLLQIGALSL